MKLKWNCKGVLSELDQEVLVAIAMGANTNKLLHERLRIKNGKRRPKSTISRHTTKLKELGLISQRIEFNTRPFVLTDKGKISISIFLRGGDQMERKLVRGHGFGFKCDILRKPRDLAERLKAGGWAEFHPKNRVGYTKGFWGYTVVFNPRSVQFIPEEVYASSGEAAFDEVFRAVLKLRDLLQAEYPGLVLGAVIIIYNQSYAREFDPLAMEFLKTSMKKGINLTYKSDRLAIDASKKWPELETIHKDFSKEDLQLIADFYEGLIRTGFQIDDFYELRAAIVEFARQLRKHYGVLDGIENAIIDFRNVVSNQGCAPQKTREVELDLAVILAGEKVQKAG